MNKFNRGMQIFLLTLCSAILLGCHTRFGNPQRPGTSGQGLPASSFVVGRNEERHGTMSSADYVHWEEVGNKVSAQRRIDDDDLNWAISMMHKPSTEPVEVHEMIMGLFLTARTFGPGQQQKIQVAVTPLLTSADKHDRKWAKAVLKKIG